MSDGELDDDLTDEWKAGETRLHQQGHNQARAATEPRRSQAISSGLVKRWRREGIDDRGKEPAARGMT